MKKMEEKKMTKLDYFKELLEAVNESTVEESEKEELITFLDKQIDGINTKAEKAKEARAKKKAEGDDLKKAIESVLTSEAQTIKDIKSQLSEDENITDAKIVARLSALVKEEKAKKEDVKLESGKTVKAYSLI